MSETIPLVFLTPVLRGVRKQKNKVTTLLGVTDSYGVSYATLPLERDNGLPPHKLLSQVRKFDACESLSEKVTQLVVCVNFD